MDATPRHTGQEPYWAPLPRPQFTWWEQAGIVLRYLIPVGAALWFGWSLSQFALLSVFNVASSMGGIAVVGLGASMLQVQEKYQTSLWDRLAGWVSLLAVVAVITLVLTLMFGWVVLVMAPEGIGLLFSSSGLWISALVTAIVSAPAVIGQMLSDASSGLSEEQRKQRDQPKVGVLFFSGIALFAMSGFAASSLGTFGLYPLMFLYTAFFIFSDLRPDLMREAIRSGRYPVQTRKSLEKQKRSGSSLVGQPGGSNASSEKDSGHRRK